MSPEGSKKGIFLTDNYIKIQVFSRAVLRVLSIPVQPLRLSPDWVRCAACDLFSYSQPGLAEGLWEQLSLDRSLCPHTEPKIRGVSAQMFYPSMLYPKEQHFSCNIFLSKPPRKQDPQLSAHCFFLLVSRDSIKVGASLTVRSVVGHHCPAQHQHPNTHRPHSLAWGEMGLMPGTCRSRTSVCCTDLRSGSLHI